MDWPPSDTVIGPSRKLPPAADPLPASKLHDELFRNMDDDVVVLTGSLAGSFPLLTSPESPLIGRPFGVGWICGEGDLDPNPGIVVLATTTGVVVCDGWW